jgi:polyisoprenoid-binding protein YceI
MKFSTGSRISLALLTIFIGSSAAYAAQSYSVSEDSAKLAFLATGKPGFLKIKGEGAKLKGRLDMDQGNWKGAFVADLVPVKTGVDLRDSHMHDKYLETKKFPTAELNLETVKFEKGAEGPCEFTGSLAIKGVKKPIQGTCEWTGTGKDSMQVKASSEIKLADYPIGVPQYLGVTVADKVKIEVEFDAKRNPSG